MAQVDGLATVRSDRYANHIIIDQVSTDLDAEQSTLIDLPVGLGEVLIAEMLVHVEGAATLMASPNTFGLVAFIVGSDATPVPLDFVGALRWVQTLSTSPGMSAVLDPDTPVLWRPGEKLWVRHEEVDTNATPTADRRIMIRALRLLSGSQGEIDPEFRLTS